MVTGDSHFGAIECARYCAKPQGMIERRPVVAVYVRSHQSNCRYSRQRNRSFVRDCTCMKWLRYSGDGCLCGDPHAGRQHRLPANTRTWGIAEERREELQRRLDSGETSPLVLRPSLPAATTTTMPALQACSTAWHSGSRV
jgi:hypothetical protein